MSYTILNTDGTTLLLLADNTVDQSATSLSLIGKNSNSYGEYYNNNLIKMLANFASTAGSPPRSPLKGQLWYDTTAKKLKIYDNGFKSLSGAIISSSQPTDLAPGDLWFDSTTDQLKVYSGTGLYTIGPAFSKLVGRNGLQLPPDFIRDSSNNNQNVTLLENYGSTVGIVSDTMFTLSATDANTYFNTTDEVTIVKGISIIGDIQYTGKISNRYIPFTIDIDKITPLTNDVTDNAHFSLQNAAIIGLLAAMFPINSTTDYIVNPLNPDSPEAGVPINSEARVVCFYSVPVAGYQVRRFIALATGWEDYEIAVGSNTIVDVTV